MVNLDKMVGNTPKFEVVQSVSGETLTLEHDKKYYLKIVNVSDKLIPDVVNGGQNEVKIYDVLDLVDNNAYSLIGGEVFNSHIGAVIDKFKDFEIIKHAPKDNKRYCEYTINAIKINE